MQVNMIPETPEEIRFVANCLLGFADLREAANADTPAQPIQAPVADKKPRRAAATKPEPEAQTQTKGLPAHEAEAALFNVAAKDGEKKVEADKGEASAGTAPEADESGKPQADAPASDITHDTLRTAFGAITDAAKRAAVVEGIKKMGFNGIKAITPDRFAEAYALMTS